MKGWRMLIQRAALFPNPTCPPRWQRCQRRLHARKGNIRIAESTSQDDLEGVRLGLGQVRLGSVAPEPVSGATARSEAGGLATYANVGEGTQSPHHPKQQVTFPVAASAPHNARRLSPLTTQHWVHPTRRRSPYEYQHEHDADPREEEKVRQEKEKDRIMKQCIAEHKARSRRATIPVLDLTGECSSSEEPTGMEIDE